MTTDDDERLREMGRRWFAEIRDKSARDEAELSAWEKLFRRRERGIMDFVGFHNGDGDGGSCGSDGGGD